MPTHVRIQTKHGKVITPHIESRCVAGLLLELHGGGHTESQTRKAMLDHNRLRDGQTVKHARGYTFEPIDVEENTDAV